MATTIIDREVDSIMEQQDLKNKDLTDSYIRKLLKAGTTLKGCDIPQELIELKRDHLKVKRLLKEKKV